jgi:hypothetical protein
MSEKTFTPEGVIAFKDALKVHTDTWLDDPQFEYQASAGNEKAYDEMGRELLSRIRDTESVPDEFLSSAVDGGMSVIPRFMYAGAAKAATRGFSLEQLESSMYNHESFQTLTRLTHEINAVANRIEIPLGLRPVSGLSVDSSLHLFKIDEETGLTIPDYLSRKQGARLDAYSQEHLSLEELSRDNESLCVGQITGLNQHIYRSMLTICMNDPHLYVATLVRSQATS